MSIFAYLIPRPNPPKNANQCGIKWQGPVLYGALLKLLHQSHEQSTVGPACSRADPLAAGPPFLCLSRTLFRKTLFQD